MDALYIDWTIELQNYIRINTSHPQCNYHKVVEFIVGLVQRMNSSLYYRIYIHNDIPLLIVTKPGATTKSILMNSHMDVAPVIDLTKGEWLYDPFSGHYDPITDRIYGRGTQDSKAQGIQYLAVLHQLRSIQLEYTLHVAFVPNKEVSGIDGMAAFVKTPQFRALNVIFVWDESCASPFQHFLIFYAERTVWHFAIRIRSVDKEDIALPPINTCEVKLKRLLDEVAEFRHRNLELNLTKYREPRIGFATTVNLTRICGGQLINSLPREIIAFFDMRIGIEMSLDEMYKEINQWTLVASGFKRSPVPPPICPRKGIHGTPLNLTNKPKPSDQTTGDGSVTIEWIKHSNKSQETDTREKICNRFITFFQDFKIPYALTIAPGSTDGHFLRDQGIPVLGFTPINLTPHLVSQTNEFIYRKQFIQNIDLMTRLIKYISHEIK